MNNGSRSDTGFDDSDLYNMDNLYRTCRESPSDYAFCLHHTSGNIWDLPDGGMKEEHFRREIDE